MLQEVYVLDDPDDPDDPDTPKKSYDQSGHQCGCIGFEFFITLTGLFIFHLCRNTHNA